MNLRFILTLTILLLVPLATADDHNKAQQAVLVTGASSGIGLNITEHLTKAGYYVYAGARKTADLKRLDAMENVSSVKLDVTKQADIDAAVTFVQDQGRGLYAIINNAGVGTFTNISETPLDDVMWIQDVNVFGPHRVNLAFMPLLKQSKGRTAIIGSISGYLAGAASGAYSMSKMATEVYTESLDKDIEQYGMQAANIAPGGYKSKIREKVVMHSLTGDYQAKGQQANLSEEQQQRLEEMRKRNDALKEPDEVSQVVVSFLQDESPKTRYMVTPNKEQALMTIRAAMTRMLESNADQPYQLSREELIQMMDELSK